MTQEDEDEETHHADSLSDSGAGLLLCRGAVWLSERGGAAGELLVHVLHLPVVGGVGADQAVDVGLGQEDEREETCE